MTRNQAPVPNSLTRRLEQTDIPYAVVGSMAVELHGAHSFTEDREILLTGSGFDSFRRKLVGSVFDPVPGRPRRFVERASGTPFEIFLTGYSAGRQGPTAVHYPDPLVASIIIENLRVLKLATLVELKLATSRYFDLADVVNLIAVHNLNESFLPQIHPSVHRDFIECLEEKRREDEYQARED